MSKEDNVQGLNPKTGQWENIPPMPFYVRTWYGAWKPVCTKHKLIFKDDANYYHHERYNDCEGGEVLMSDHMRHLKGYKKV